MFGGILLKYFQLIFRDENEIHGKRIVIQCMSVRNHVLTFLSIVNKCQTVKQFINFFKYTLSLKRYMNRLRRCNFVKVFSFLLEILT